MKKTLLLFIFIPFFVFTQNTTVDSLKTLLKKATQDSTKLRYRQLIGEYLEVNRVGYWDSLRVDASKLKLIKIEAAAMNNVGLVYDIKGEIDKATLFYNRSLALREKINDKPGIVMTLGNLGSVYMNQGQLDKSLEYYNRSLKIAEEINDKHGIAGMCCEIALVKKNKGEFEEAMALYERAIILSKEIEDLSGMGQNLMAIAIIHQIQGEQKKALDYYERALKLFIKNQDESGASAAYCNIGTAHLTLGHNSEALKYQLKGLEIIEKLGDKKALAQQLNNLSGVYYRVGDVNKTIEILNRSLNLRIELGEKAGIAGVLMKFAQIYTDQGDVVKALDFYTRSLKIHEELNDQASAASCYVNMGATYSGQGDDVNALKYYQKGLKIQEALKMPEQIASTLNNIGFLSYKKKDYKKAMLFYTRSLKIREEIGDKFGIAISLNNIGSIFRDKGELDVALKYYLQVLSLYTELNNKSGLARIYKNLGEIYFKQHQNRLAKSYLTKSLQFSEELGFPESIQNSAYLLSKLDSASGDFASAYQHFKLYILFRDSINNKETRKASFKTQLKYEYDKKAVTDSLKGQEEKKLISLQLSQEKAKSYMLYGGLALVCFFALFMFNRFRVTQKQKKIIELKEKETQIQKHIIEEKHKEITDSINYAERIQRSFIATKELLDENLKDYFVLFKPKDVVSGDFYWASKLSNGNFAFVTADSTGHGVPGAIMSLLNITSLEKAIETLIEPSEILNSTRTTIIERLKKDGSESGGKDGMDCSLTVFDFKNNKLVIAAANNPVWIIKGAELIEIKPDKMPVGKHEKDHVNFSQQEIELQKGDVIYTLTDGFPDQFGGESGKKFMSKKLKELLAKNAHLPMHEQKMILETTFTNWTGSIEQVDDVTLIGVRI